MGGCTRADKVGIESGFPARDARVGSVSMELDNDRVTKPDIPR